jgi:hypothetical protein
VALRPRLLPGVPLSGDGTTDLRAGTGPVKHTPELHPAAQAAVTPLTGCPLEIPSGPPKRGAPSPEHPATHSPEVLRIHRLWFRSSTRVHAAGSPGRFQASAGGTLAQR